MSLWYSDTIAFRFLWQLQRKWGFVFHARHHYSTTAVTKLLICSRKAEFHLVERKTFQWKLNVEMTTWYKRSLTNWVALSVRTQEAIPCFSHRKAQHTQHTLTQALVGHDDVSVVLALLLPTLAPAVDADGLVGFHHVGDLKVWVHLGNSTDKEVSLQKGQTMCRAAPTLAE